VSHEQHLLTAFALDWHLTRSEAFRDLLVRPLAPYVGIELLAWDGREAGKRVPSDGPLIFCQLPPPQTLLSDPSSKLVWIPMWDHASGYEDDWWSSLPHHLRIVAFSKAVAERSRHAGLPTLELKFFADPTEYVPTAWQHEPVVFYWNRTGLIDRRFLAKVCCVLGARELIFRSDLDPRIDESRRYAPPDRLGRTRVRVVSYSDRASYLAGAGEANVFLAPRRREGAGMTVIEAQARGCAVLACDEPTMNEYIEHGKTGFLFRPPTAGRLGSRGRRAGTLPLRQDWSALSGLDLREAGDLAREQHKVGFEVWSASLPRFAGFLTDW
jgi:hypothetical protein